MRFKWLLYILTAIIIFLVANILFVAGSFKKIEPHLRGDLLQAYEGIPGPEDMDLDETTGSIFISSCDRWRLQQGLDAPTDGIYLLQPDSGQPPRKLTSTYAGAFHPHGISFIRMHDTAYLYVVNHSPSGDHVEVFDLRNDTLYHLRTIADEMMNTPNDLVAVGRDRFYVTNDHGYKQGVMRMLEEYLQLPFSSVLYYNGAGFAKVAGRLRYANGVNVSNNGTRLYVTTTIGRNLLTYHRDTATGQLTLAGRLPLKTGLDNIDVDADGDLWIGAHPKLLAFVGHAKDPAKLSPSQVLRLSPAPGDTYTVAEMMMDKGDNLSGASVALRYKDTMYVGAVFQPRVLRVALKRGWE
ncbi:MAG TPA: SMP-30/gluconolactonase/LRE family protein [Phnomibacter sp.]|nr:SMP-30/gluconolactonase/LRE family protein [Phnomibacter sp.]